MKFKDLYEKGLDRKVNPAVSASDLTETTAKRYLRQLTEFGYLEAHGGNRNKSYTRK